MTRIGVFLAVLLIGLFGWAEEGGVRVDLGSVEFTFTSEGEKELSLPLSLSATGKIARVSTEIVYPSKYLTFLKGTAKGKGAKLEAATKPDEREGEKTRLVVTVAAEPGQALGTGVIAELEFKISPLTPDGVLALPNFPKAYSLENPSTPLEKVEGSFGSIQVSTKVEPIISCFFYMH